MAIHPAEGAFKRGDTVVYGPFPKGMNNIDNALSMKDDELVNAVNLDVNKEGILTRRDGSTVVISAVAHSLWGRDQATAFYVKGTDLCMLTESSPGTVVSATLRAGVFQVRRPLSYVLVNGDTYYSNGLITGMIRADNSLHPWGVELPSRRPSLTRAAGNLPSGWYMVALQYVTDRGEVGGMTQAVAINVVADSSIVVSSIPQPVDADVEFISIYVSEQNGDVLYHYGDYALGTTSATLTATSTAGDVARNILSDVMPPTDLLEYYNGRIYGATGSLIWYTNPLQYGQCAPRSNFIPMNGTVSIIKAVSDGVFVGTDSAVIFFKGDGPEEFTLEPVFDYGAIPGSGITIQKDHPDIVVSFLTERGFVKGSAGGKVDTGDKERAMVGMFTQGAAFFRELNGVRQVVTTMRGQTRNALVSADYAEAEVRRNGEVI